MSVRRHAIIEGEKANRAESAILGGVILIAVSFGMLLTHHEDVFGLLSSKVGGTVVTGLGILGLVSIITGAQARIHPRNLESDESRFAK